MAQGFSNPSIQPTSNPFDFSPSFFSGQPQQPMFAAPPPQPSWATGGAATPFFTPAQPPIGLNDRGVPNATQTTPNGWSMDAFNMAMKPMFAATASLPVYQGGQPFTAEGTQMMNTNKSAFPGWAAQTNPTPNVAPPLTQDQITQMVNDAIAKQIAAAQKPTQAQLDQQFINQQNWGIGGPNNVGGQGA